MRSLQQASRALRGVAVWLAFALACSQLPQAQAQAVGQGTSRAGFDATRLARLDAYLERRTAAGGYLGAVAFVLYDGRIVHRGAFGHRDLARRDPMHEDAIFRIYSMTKPLLSVAVLMEMEAGRLGLDDPVSKYLPELAGLQVVDGGTSASPRLRAPSTPVTLRHLLTHTAGFPAGLAGDDTAAALRERADPESAPDLRGYVQRLARAPLAADPGTRFGYDSAASETLARVVEVTSGLRFADYLRQRILVPLRMRDTGFDVPPGQRARIADLTRMSGDGSLQLDDSPSARAPGTRLRAYDSGAGGLYSTAGDYARFCAMLLGDATLDGTRLLGRKTVELMLSNHLGMLDPPVNQYSRAEGFGLGGYVVLDPAGRGMPGSVGQFGWSGAASTYFTIDPRERVGIVLLLQHIPREGGHDLPRIGRTAYTLVYQALE